MRSFKNNFTLKLFKPYYKVNFMELKAATSAQDYTFAQEQYNAGDINQGESTMIIHQDFKHFDLEKFAPTRRRMIGNMTTGDIPSYFDYVQKRQAESEEVVRTFVDASDVKHSLTAKTVLNFGDSNAPGQSDDLAFLKMTRDPLLENFMETFSDETFGAVKFAEAFEDLLGVLPMVAYTGTTQISVAAAITIIRNTKVDSAQNTTVKATQYTQENSTMESVEISSNAGELPTHIIVQTPMYLGLNEQEIQFKIKAESVPAGEGKTKLQYSLKPIGLLGAYLKAGQNFKELISDQFGAEAVTIGTYTK